MHKFVNRPFHLVLMWMLTDQQSVLIKFSAASFFPKANNIKPLPGQENTNENSGTHSEEAFSYLI